MRRPPRSVRGLQGRRRPHLQGPPHHQSAGGAGAYLVQQHEARGEAVD